MAPPTFTELTVINAALFAMGEEEITARSDTDKRARVMDAIYDRVAFACLTRRDWRFATWAAQVSATTTGTLPTVDEQWEYFHRLPTDLERLLHIYPPIRYEIMDDVICSNYNTDLQLHYIREMEESDWPPYFVEYVIAELVIRTMKGITGNDPGPDEWKMRDNALVEATIMDAQQQPNREPLPNPFVDIRH